LRPLGRGGIADPRHHAAQRSATASNRALEMIGRSPWEPESTRWPPRIASPGIRLPTNGCRWSADRSAAPPLHAAELLHLPKDEWLEYGTARLHQSKERRSSW